MQEPPQPAGRARGDGQGATGGTSRGHHAGWRQTVDAVLDAPGTVVMLGAVDVGKTTAATALANSALRAGLRPAVVDADTGQSDLGPPATVGLGLPRGPVRRMSEIPLVAAYFVGDTSPAAVYDHLVEGTARMLSRARAASAQIIVVDTTGWVEGAAAVAAKLRKIRRIQPRHVIALQRAGEVEPILAGLPGSVAVHRLAPSPRVRPRDRAARRAFRERRFAEYFADARRFVLDLRTVRADRPVLYAGRRIPQARMLAEIPEGLLRHLLVGLAGRSYEDEFLRLAAPVEEAAPRVVRLRRA